MPAVHAYNAFSTDHYALETYMELEQLRQLQAVAEEGTISAAADALHLTQPTLSRSIQRLERELGTELFRRTKNHVEFNEAGELALAAAADLTARAETLRRDLAALSRKQRTVTVASAAPAPSWRLAKLATQFMPGLILDPELAANPERADADLRITLRPPGHQLMTEDLYANVPAEHRLAGRRHVRFADLNGEPFLVLTDIGFWMDVVRSYLPDSELLVQRDATVFEQLLAHSPLLAFSTQVSQPRPGRTSIPLADASAHATFFLAPSPHASASARELYAAITRS